MDNDGGPAFPNLDPQTGEGPTGMRLRQYAAIKLRVPSSGTEWLDDVIRASLRDELAAKAMQTFAAQQIMPNMSRPPDEAIAAWAYAMADAMLRAREVKS